MSTPFTTEATMNPTEQAWAAVWAADALLTALGDYGNDPNPVTHRWLERRLSDAIQAVDGAKAALGVTYPARYGRYTLTPLGEAALASEPPRARKGVA
jgi:hypothetical protein